MTPNHEHAFGSQRQLFTLIDLIYQAVQEPELWAAVVEQLADAIQGDSTAIIAVLPGQPALVSAARTDPATWESYASHYASVNVLLRDESGPPNSKLLFSHHTIGNAEFERTEFYTDFFRPNDMYYSYGTRFAIPHFDPAVNSGHITSQRSRAKGPFGATEGAILQTLLPHFQRAISLHLQFNQLQSTVRSLESALDAFGQAVFVLNRRGNVILANRFAEQTLERHSALQLANGRLTALHPPQDRKLQEMLAAAVATGSGDGLSAGSSMVLTGPHLRRPGHLTAGEAYLAALSGLAAGSEPSLRVTVTPFRSALAGSSDQAAALVFVSDPATKPGSRAHLLRTLYNLTPTELRVADLLLEGRETREISDTLALTLETTRFHIKRILTKTQTHRQTELIRLMLSLPAAQ